MPARPKPWLRTETIDAFVPTGRPGPTPGSALTYRSLLRRLRDALVRVQRGEAPAVRMSAPAVRDAPYRVVDFGTRGLRRIERSLAVGRDERTPSPSAGSGGHRTRQRRLTFVRAPRMASAAARAQAPPSHSTPRRVSVSTMRPPARAPRPMDRLNTATHRAEAASTA